MKETALITGASGGIGYELARIFAREGYDLALVARSGEKLSAIGRELAGDYGAAVETIALDLGAEDAPREIFDRLSAENRPVDILVNNAGFGDFGDFAAADWDKLSSMVQLNCSALMHLTKLFLGPMLERGRGRILNLASTAAFMPGPLMAVYYASKAFVLSFSEAVARELQGSGVTMTALCPGPTRTGFRDAASLQDSGLFKNLKVARAEDVAAYGYRALMKGRKVAIQGAFNKALIFGLRLTPRSLVRNIVLGIQGPRAKARRDGRARQRA
ncbi:MAG TPA: SDR family oxidoreductase [Rectinemataceae bacterium]|nr:SDR family oxidoreductase [Rectinemataceae bacterium]